MNFRREELSGGTGGLARGEALRRVGGFLKMDDGEIKRIKKEAFAG